MIQNKKADLELRLKEVGDENELLLLQLHRIQEELERYYFRNQALVSQRSECEQNTSVSIVNHRSEHEQSTSVPVEDRVDHELVDLFAENERLRVLLDVQRKVHRLEAQDTLNAKLGNLLIQAVDSPRTLVGLPRKLAGIWWAYRRLAPPKFLGGKGFPNVLAAFDEGGFDAVEKLMGVIAVQPAVQANAYTVLARKLMFGNCRGAAEAARRAHALDPKPYRLKWLAFRLHEAGEVIEADAVLDLLSSDTPFSESEARQASQLRHEASQNLRIAAKEKAETSDVRAAISRRFNGLVRKRDEQLELLSERSREAEALKQGKARAEEERGTLSNKHEAAIKQLVTLGQEVEILRQAEAQLQREKVMQDDRHEGVLQKLNERSLQIEVLERTKSTLVQETMAIAARYEQALQVLAARGQEVEILRETKAELDEKSSVLAGTLEDHTLRLAALAREVETLTRARDEFERENLMLMVRNEEAVQQLSARCRDVEALTSAMAKVEDEKSVLDRNHEAAVERLIAVDREVEALKLLKSELEQERSTLFGQRDQLARKLAERDGGIAILQQVNSRFEQQKLALVGRHEDAAKLIVERERELEAVARENLELIQQRNADTALAAERLDQINALEEVIRSREAGEADLAARQRLMQEEMVRAEAQLDLIKDMLFNEPKL